MPIGIQVSLHHITVCRIAHDCNRDTHRRKNLKSRHMAKLF
jgi:hypothetical protein